MKKALKRAVRAVLDRTLVPTAAHVARSLPRDALSEELARRTASECADYVQERMALALQFSKRGDLLVHALERAPAEGLIAEFGVWRGVSLNLLARAARPRIVHGFDSFQGLREDWRGWGLRKGTFDTGGRAPRVEPNVRLTAGWFDASLPGFLSSNPGPFSFAHVDSDTYEAAHCVLGLIGPRIAEGTVIVFDEYLGYRGWRLGEFRAWQEFVAARSVAYEYLGFSEQSVSIRVTRA